MRVRHLLTVGLAAVFGACASSGASEDPNAPQACIVVDNSQGGGTAGRVMLESESGFRTRLGEVPMGQTLRQCIRRSNFAGVWWIVIENAASDTFDPADAVRGGRVERGGLESEYFYINPGDEITWQVHVDRLIVGRIGGGG